MNQTVIGSEQSGAPAPVAGSEEAGAPDAGQTVEATNGSTDPNQTPFDGLQDEGAREWVKAKGYQSVDDVVSAAHSLEGKLGESLNVPGEDAKPEDWDKFYGKIGRPDEPDAYVFNMPDGLEEDFPYSEENANTFKQWAFDEGLRPDQAQRLHDKFVTQQNGSFAEMKASQEEVQKEHVANVEAAHDALVKDWGAPETESYKRSVEMADRAVRNLDPELRSELVTLGALGEGGEVKSPTIIKTMAKIGETLYAEDALYGSETAAMGANPFAEETFNLTEQGKVVSADPKRARKMVLAAGLKPSDYGLEE